VQYHTTWPVIVLCLLTFLVSCSVPAQPRAVLARVEETEMEQFFQYFARLRALSRDALQREYAQQESAFVHSRSAVDRLRLALLLSLPDTNFENTTYALELLQEYLNEPTQSHAQFREIAVFLYTFIQNKKPDDVPSEPLIAKQLQEALRDQERQLGAQQQLNKKLQTDLEAQKSLAHSLSKQLQEALSDKERELIAQQQLSKKLQDEKRNVRRLQEKIEKIKDIEKSLIEKEHTNDKGT
jgi:DNA repair exonuclease SbcCD ATPase subunit